MRNLSPADPMMAWPGAQPPSTPAPGPLPQPVTNPQETHTAPPAAAAGGGPGRPLTAAERAAVTVVGSAVGVLGLVGFGNSFAAVYQAARPSFGWWAWTVPLGIDLGIGVFTAVDIVLCRLDMRLRWLRVIPWTLVAVTIYLNVASAHTLYGQIAHAALPALWVAAVEVAAHVIRTRARLASATRMDRIRPSRWLLAPARTVLLWRRMVLWEIRCYPDALARERDRLLALTDLQDTYGALAWRWRAPRRKRALYRLGELTPTGDTPALPAATDGPDTTPTDPTPAPPAGESASDRPAAPAANGRGTRKRPARRAAAGTDTATAVARLRARHPDMTQTEIARRLGVSDRTVRRHLDNGDTTATTAAAAATTDDNQPGRG